MLESGGISHTLWPDTPQFAQELLSSSHGGVGPCRTWASLAVARLAAAHQGVWELYDMLDYISVIFQFWIFLDSWSWHPLHGSEESCTPDSQGNGCPPQHYFTVSQILTLLSKMLFKQKSMSRMHLKEKHFQNTSAGACLSKSE